MRDFKNTMKKAILVFLLTFLLLGDVSTKAASASWWDPTFTDFKEKVELPSAENPNGTPENEIFGERYTVAQVNWIIHALSMQSWGSLVKCFQKDPNSVEACVKKTASTGSPMLFLAGLNDSMLSNRPVSGVDYIQQKVAQLSPIKSANAQGYGYQTALHPIQNIWLATRNVAFGLMSFVIIILAFMIMLRQKISPQAVITAQSALPKVAVALVVITFSYAIAGLMVDLTYVIFGLFAAVIASSGLSDNHDVLNLFTRINAPFDLINGGFGGWVKLVIGFINTTGALTGVAVGAIGGLGAIPGVGILTGLLVLIVSVIFLIALFRCFLTLLRAYASCLFLVIGFPLIALLSVVSIGPGVGGWIRQFAAHLAVFVGIAGAIVLSQMVMWTTDRGALATVANLYNANVFQFTSQGGGGAQFPAFGGFDISAITFFVAFGILFSAPKLATSLRDQVATGRGGYGFDSGGTILGSGVPFIGGIAVGQMNRLQTGIGNIATTMGGTWINRALKGRGKDNSSTVPIGGSATTSQAQRPAPTGNITESGKAKTDSL